MSSLVAGTRSWCMFAALIVCASFLAGQTPSAEALFRQAVAAQERGDDATAVIKYQELLRSHPDAEEVRVNLGAALAHEKHFSEAIDQYRTVLASDPGNRLARMNLAAAYQDSGNSAQALAELEQLHRDNANDGQTALALANIYEQSQRYADAISLLTPLAATNPDDPDVTETLGKALIRSGKLADGASLAEKAADQNASPEDYLLAGQARFGMSQFDMARRDAGAAEHLDPRIAGLDALRGMIMEQTSDYDGAEAALLQALSSDPDDFNAHFYLGGIFYFKRDLRKAMLHLNRALQLQPGSAQVRYELALVERAEGKLNEAVKNLEAAVKQIPEWLQPHVELAALYYRLHRPEDGARERHTVDAMMADLQKSYAESASPVPVRVP